MAIRRDHLHAESIGRCSWTTTSQQTGRTDFLTFRFLSTTWIAIYELKETLTSRESSGTIGCCISKKNRRRDLPAMAIVIYSHLVLRLVGSTLRFQHSLLEFRELEKKRKQRSANFFLLDRSKFSLNLYFNNIFLPKNWFWRSSKSRIVSRQIRIYLDINVGSEKR